ncbi:MAG TPA: amidohydrolase family protein [Chloroflexota bacterium]|jgi:N-acyl-D-aspartate/D-glutamate deacylase
MAYDLVIRNATIVDGAGAPRRGGGVAIEGGLIRAVGDVSDDARRVVDARGQVVAPGFIDPHTHMDFWVKKYPAGQPVVNYGVTTVVICDCGAALAPVPPKGAQRDILMAYLHRVLDKYVDDAAFEWTTWEEYLACLEGNVGINVGAFAPHSPIRLAVMGEDAGKRTATPDELAKMVEYVERYWEAGAIGFSSSPRGGPLIHSDTPSTFADRNEMLTLAGTVGTKGGIVQYNGFGRVMEEDSELHYLAHNVPARLILNEWAQAAGDDDSGRRGAEALKQLNAEGRPAWGVVVPYQHLQNMRAATFAPLQGVPAWEDLPKEPEALRERLADPALRATLRAAAAERGAACLWDELQVKRVVRDADRHWEGRRVADAARETGQAPVDFALDLLQHDDGNTRFCRIGARNHSLEILGEMIRSPYAVIGTDAGAHLDTFYFYGTPARILGHWSREKGLLTLEEAVHKLTGFNTEMLGIQRGLLEPGRPADVVVFDPDTIGDVVTPRYPYYVDEAEIRRNPPGVELVVVNGEVVAEQGEPTTARPGKVRRWEL